MAKKFVSERNLKFLLHEVFDAESLTQYDRYKDHNRKMFDMVLNAAVKLAKDMLRPIFEEMDRSQPELVDGTVKVHPTVGSIMKEFGEGGWIAANAPIEKGGEQLPHILTDCCRFIFMAANYSAAAFGELTTGAAHLIESFGTRELFETYTPKMYAGEWQGTMAITEPEAGSSLSDLVTVAEPAPEGHYLIRGQKIFISAGDHDGVENVVHLTLARLNDAPPGVKGLSLFVVPKKRLDENGNLVFNDVVTAGVFHKMGYRGCPITHLSFGDSDDCRGYLVGEPNMGLACMFQMMNEARIGVGVGAVGLATAAYYASLDYAKERRQGRNIDQKDPTLPQVPIIEHADVKRMLLFQRAVSEGALSLLIQCSKYVDLQKVLDGEEKEKYSLLLDLLTPVAKSYPSEMGILGISQGLQILGGSGYCDDYPLEQYYRDARIHPIHEGTTTIHGMDILGRKVQLKNGRALELYLAEVKNAIESAGADDALAPYGRKLSTTLEQLERITQELRTAKEDKGVEIFLADATLYLEYFGIITIAWQWLLQGLAIRKALTNGCSRKNVTFYNGKLITMKYFFEYELPKTAGLAERLVKCDGLTVEANSKMFSD
jgi:butyryl-CoA dehydrogenase